jgi:ABC-type sugar transport system substrate-binding protein
VDGILISPTDSSTAPSVLSLAEKANIPVVIADIGPASGTTSRSSSQTMRKALTIPA